jgi:tetratricopeptide (TPR) repeat protein
MSLEHAMQFVQIVMEDKALRDKIAKGETISKLAAEAGLHFTAEEYQAATETYAGEKRRSAKIYEETAMKTLEAHFAQSPAPASSNGATEWRELLKRADRLLQKGDPHRDIILEGMERLALADDVGVDDLLDLLKQEALAKQSGEDVQVTIADLAQEARDQRSKGQLDIVSQLLDRAEKLLPLMSNEHEYHQNAALVYIAMQRFDDAAQHIRQQVRLLGSDIGMISADSGLSGVLDASAWAAVGQYTAFKNRYMMQLFVLAHAYQDAIDLYEQQRQASGTSWWIVSDQPWDDICWAGDAYYGAGRYVKALQHYEEAIRQVEARRAKLGRDEAQAVFADEKIVSHPYYGAALSRLRLAADHDDTTSTQQVVEAFDAAEKSRVRALLDQTDLETTLAREIPDFHSRLSYESGVPSLPEIQAALPANTLLLVYAADYDELMAWAISSTGSIHTHIVEYDRRELRYQAEEYHTRLAHGRDASELASQFATHLLEPFAAQINQHQHLIIVPPDDASIVPFATLPLRNIPIGDSHNISTIPSAAIITLVP